MTKLKTTKNYEFPIKGFEMYGFDFTYFIRIIFLKNIEEAWKYQLEIHGEYQIKRYGQEYKFKATDIEGYKILLDFTYEKIKSCKADKGGYFWLETEKGNEITIEDGPFENWHFRIYQQTCKLKTKLHVIGGVGNTTIFNE